MKSPPVPRAIDTSRAAERLQSAMIAIASILGRPITPEEFQRNWRDFLIHAHGVYVQLEAACKNTPEGRQWFGAKKAERKKDPLMQYLHQARHADEHTVDVVATVGPLHAVTLTQSATIGLGSDGMPEILNEDGTIQPLVFKGFTAILLPVTGRGTDVVFYPPRAHKGISIMATPEEASKLALIYLSDLVEEASSRA